MFTPQAIAPRAVAPAFDMTQMMAFIMPLMMMVLMMSILRPMMKAMAPKD